MLKSFISIGRRVPHQPNSLQKEEENIIVDCHQPTSVRADILKVFYDNL
jgi:hypothetical protein